MDPWQLLLQLEFAPSGTYLEKDQNRKHFDRLEEIVEISMNSCEFEGLLKALTLSEEDYL
jgi:hypothetical protein